MLPEITDRHALFLDLDGTLLDFAASPAEVETPPCLPPLLAGLAGQRDGALAILSGRTLDDIDRAIPPRADGAVLPAGAEHGMILREPGGRVHRRDLASANRPAWRAALERAVAERGGGWIEVKSGSLVAHFRGAPDLGPHLRSLIDAMVDGDDTAEVLPAHMAWEIRPRGAGKGHALEWFMAHAPFRGRIPVFVGDDVTDEEAIDAARRLGGIGLHVARDFDGTTRAVRAWLASFCTDAACATD